MAYTRPERNHRASDIVVTGTGPHGEILLTDFTDSSVRLADVVAIDQDTNPAFQHNVITVKDERFEIRDGGLYLKAGMHVEPGKLNLKFYAIDEFSDRLSRTEKLVVNVTHQSVLAIATVSGDTLSFNYAGTYDVAKNNDGSWHITKGNTSVDISASRIAGVKNLDLHANETVNITAAAITGKSLAIHGVETNVVNISGVTFTQSTGGSSVDSNTDLSHFSTTTQFTVNQSTTDTFIARWNILDDFYAYLQSAYGNNLMFGLNQYSESATLPGGMTILGQTTNGAAALAVNQAVTQLDLDYANYLEEGGSAGNLRDFMAKTAANGTRFQSIHDNLLGSATVAAIGDRNFPGVIKDMLIGQIPDDYGTRPYSNGVIDAYGHTSAGTNAAKAWDYDHGIARSDYVTHFIGPIDPVGTQPNGAMWFGAGNPSTGYAIGVHDGAGVEFGFNVHYRTGDQIAGHVANDGLVHYDAPAGHQQVAAGHNVQNDNLSRSLTSVDFALVSGLNGTDGTTGDYVVHMYVDLDPSAATAYKAFTLQHSSTGVDFMVADDGIGAFGDDDGVHANVAVNSLNFGFGFLSNSQTANTGDLQAGTYDIYAQVFDSTGTVLLVGNHVVLDVTNPIIMA